MTLPTLAARLRAFTRAQARPASTTAGRTWTQTLLVPFHGYERMQARSPYKTQIYSSIIIYFLGDLSAQLMTARSSTNSNSDEHAYAPERGLRAMTIGACAALPSYHWFLFLGRHFNYSSHILSLAVKLVVNQIVFSPFVNVFFFGMHGVMSGQAWGDIKDRLVNTVPTSVLNSCRFWPLVTAFNFTFLPPRHRSVSAGVFNIFWQTYLSWLNGVADREGEEKARKLAKV